MGVGGACTMPSTLSILGNIFPEHERGRAISSWSAVAGTVTAVGPIAGGLLLAHFWWGSVFLVNVPIAWWSIVLARCGCRGRTTRRRRRSTGGARCCGGARSAP